MNKLASRFMCYIAVFFIFISASFAQQADWKKVDSMKVLLPKTSGQAKYPLYFGMAYELFDVDNQKAVLYADSAYSLIKSTPDSAEMVKSGRLYGQLLRRTDRLDDAMNLLEGILPVAVRNQFEREEKFILNALAICYNHHARYDKALAVHLRSLDLREKEGEKKDISIALENIALVYYKMGNSDRALQFYNKSIQLYDDRWNLPKHFPANLALCYISLGDYEKGWELIESGIAGCQEGCMENLLANLEFAQGLYFFKRDDYEAAILHFKKSYAIAKSEQDKRFMAENASKLGDIALKRRDFDLAIKNFSEAEQLARESGYDQVSMNIFLLLSDLYNKLENCDQSSYYQQAHIKLRSIIFSTDVIKNVARLQTQYDERENLKLIKAQDENLALKDRIIETQKRQQLFSVAIVFLLALIAVLLFQINRVRVRMNKELDRKVKERTLKLEESQDRLQRLLLDQSKFIGLVRNDLVELSAGLNGLSRLIQKESNITQDAEYVREYQTLSIRLDNVIKQLAAN